MVLDDPSVFKTQHLTQKKQKQKQILKRDRDLFTFRVKRLYRFKVGFQNS